MQPRPDQCLDHSHARDGDRPVLPPIRDWFRDEFAASTHPPNRPSSLSSPYQFQENAPHLGRAMPGFVSSLPASPRQDYYKTHASTHSYPSYPNPMPRSLTPGYARIPSDESNNRFGHAQHAGVRMNYQDWDVRRMPDSAVYNSMQAPGPSLSPRMDPSYQGRSSPLSKYGCSYCGKGFNRPSSLKTHLNTHTGEKPFVCPHEGCGRAFSVQSNMRRHARVHSPPITAPTTDSSGEERDDSPFDHNTDPNTPSTPPSSSVPVEQASHSS